jgi:GNAT superfamily N-acetyltransferase
MHIANTKEVIHHFSLVGENWCGGCEINIYPGKKECLIHSLIVYKGFRLNGNGTAFIKEAERLILNEGYTKSYLYVQKLIWQHNWYKRLGYEDTTDICQKGYVKMIKELI